MAFSKLGAKEVGLISEGGLIKFLQYYLKPCVISRLQFCFFVKVWAVQVMEICLGWKIDLFILKDFLK